VIRLLWVGLNIVLSTYFFGFIAIVASLLRVRGRIYYWCTQQWSRAILWASATPVVTHGMAEIDWRQPVILVANHVSGYDIFALAAVVPVPYSFVAKKELERIPFFGRAWQAAGHISIDRSDRQKAVQSLRRAGEKIHAEHGAVIIFPEGTRSRTGELLPFKKGAFVLALDARVPVVPVAIVGSERIVRPGRRGIRPGPIHLHFGEAIPVGEEAAGGPDALIAAARGRMLELLARGRDA
jgi:1-acyl-sn-glycerol-3-phosphate acyltransferase